MSLITDEQVVARLNSLGVPLEYIFVLPIESQNRGLIGFWHQEIGFRYLIIENDKVADACYTYLQNRGARRFNTNEELEQAIATEKWPGWDTCADAVRGRQVRDSAQVI
jgi:hypothetical protein